jgi:hypothetical protein
MNIFIGDAIVMERELELKLGMYLSTKFACFLGEQINLLTIEHEISYDEWVRLAKSALELNLSIYREAGEEA